MRCSPASGAHRAASLRTTPPWRRRIAGGGVPIKHRDRAIAQVGRPIVRVDGFVPATPAIEPEPRGAILRTGTLDREGSVHEAAIAREGLQLVAFVAPDAGEARVRFARARL